MDLRQATENLIAFEAALEDGTARDAGDTEAVVAGYNEDDCRATLALRDWLEQRRAELAGRLGADLPRPAAVAEPEATEDPERHPDPVRAAGRRARGWSARTREQKAKALLADLLDWHRREAKPAVVAVLLCPHAERRRADRRAGRAGRPDRRRGRRAGEEVGGAPVLVPAAGVPVQARGWRRRPGLRAALSGVGRGRRARDDRPEGRAGLPGTVAGGAGRGRPGRAPGAGGAAPRPRRPGRARRRDRPGRRRPRSCCGCAPTPVAARRGRCAATASRPPRRRSGSCWRSGAPTCRSRDHPEPGRRSPPPCRSSSSSRPGARSASPALRTLSSTT